MQSFLEATRGAPAHPSLRKALNLWRGSPGLALDLGCGAGRDSIALAQAGWQVIAIDRDAHAIDAVQEQASTYPPGLLTTLCRSFEDHSPLPDADLINAAFSLPFCQPVAFGDLWLRIKQALRSGGLFSGHLFGPNDDWANRGVSIHSHEQVLQLFEDWTVLELNELEFDGKTAVGEAKHWHMFELVARLG